MRVEPPGRLVRPGRRRSAVGAPPPAHCRRRMAVPDPSEQDVVDYPRRGESRRAPLAAVLEAVAGAGFAGFGLAVIAFGVVYARTDIPKPNQLRPGADHDRLLRRRQDRAGPRSSRRTARRCRCRQVPLARAARRARRRGPQFYTNHGVARSGIARARLKRPPAAAAAGRLDDHPAVREELLPDPAAHAVPQGQGVLLAIKIEQQLTKDQILEDYLNTIYFGRGAYGIQAASQGVLRQGRRASSRRPRVRVLAA